MPIHDQAPALRKLAEDISQAEFGLGQTPQRAADTGLCISCHRPGLANCYSEAGRREFGISGLCERCFDRMFAEDEED